MYDVVEKKEVGDSLVFVCWWDHEETYLKEQMNKLLAGSMNDNPLNNDRSDRIERFVKNLYCTSFNVLERTKKIDNQKELPPFKGLAHSSPYQSVLTPPPKWSYLNS